MLVTTLVDSFLVCCMLEVMCGWAAVASSWFFTLQVLQHWPLLEYFRKVRLDSKSLWCSRHQGGRRGYIKNPRIQIVLKRTFSFSLCLAVSVVPNTTV